MQKQLRRSLTATTHPQVRPRHAQARVSRSRGGRQAPVRLEVSKSRHKTQRHSPTCQIIMSPPKRPCALIEEQVYEVEVPLSLPCRIKPCIFHCGRWCLLSGLAATSRPQRSLYRVIWDIPFFLFRDLHNRRDDHDSNHHVNNVLPGIAIWRGRYESAAAQLGEPDLSFRT